MGFVTALRDTVEVMEERREASGPLIPSLSSFRLILIRFYNEVI